MEQNIGELILEVRKIKDRCDEIEKTLEAENVLLKEAQLKVDSFLEENNIPSVKVEGAGTYYLKTELSYKLPVEPEKKEACFAYIKEKFGEDIFTVHSATFNKICKDAMEAAVSNGDVDFTIPGVDEPKPYKKGVLLKR